jgi:hypothetical protein
MEEGYRDIGVLLYAHMNTNSQNGQRQSSPPAVSAFVVVVYKFLTKIFSYAMGCYCC